MLQSFVEQMEDENDRLIEMMAALRRHVDERLSVPPPRAVKTDADPVPESIPRAAGRLASIERELLRLRLRVERLEEVAPQRRTRNRGTLEARSASVKTVRAAGEDRPAGEDILPFDPSDLKAPFQEATRRIADGEEARKVGRDLGLVSGEVEILERLVRAAASERQSRG